MAEALHQRASVLLERAGDIDAALDQALAAGDVARAADIVLAHAAPLSLGGRVSVLIRRLERLGPGSMDAGVSAALAWAWAGVANADAVLIERATAAAERADDGAPLPDGVTTVTVAVAALRGFAGSRGVPGILEETDVVLAEGAESMRAWWGVGLSLRATALSALDRRDEARALLLAARSTIDDLPALAAGVESHLALLAVYDGDDQLAERHTANARRIRRHLDLEAMPMATVVFAVDALVSARAGRRTEADEQAQVARALVAQLDDAAPRAALLCHSLLARTALLLGDRTGARRHARCADRARSLDPVATRLNDQLDEIHRLLDAGSGSVVVGPPLTAAELRVLPYLATHLSLREIADELIISRNTAKSHAVAIYRKLGATSRSEAVAQATALGLLTG